MRKTIFVGLNFLMKVFALLSFLSFLIAMGLLGVMIFMGANESQHPFYYIFNFLGLSLVLATMALATSLAAIASE